MSAGEDFWAFSLRVYGQAEVPAACLALQNDHGLDVNLLLYCCWLGIHGIELDIAALARALEFADPWSKHVVRPLRDARTWMKRASDAREKLPPDVYTELRESIKTIELQAERLEQLALAALTDRAALRPAGADGAASCAQANLELYVTEAGSTPAADMRAHLAKIIDASVSTMPIAPVAATGASDEHASDV